VGTGTSGLFILLTQILSQEAMTEAGRAEHGKVSVMGLAWTRVNTDQGRGGDADQDGGSDNDGLHHHVGTELDLGREMLARFRIEVLVPRSSTLLGKSVPSN